MLCYEATARDEEVDGARRLQPLRETHEVVARISALMGGTA